MRNLSTLPAKRSDESIVIKVESQLFVRKLPCPNEYYVTKKSTRLDMISMELYNTPEYDWLLARVNGLISTNVKEGIVLHYPDISSINKFLNKDI